MFRFSTKRKTYGGVVGAGGEGVARRMEADTVDVGAVAVEDLDVVAGADVPDEDDVVGAARQEEVARLGRRHVQAHHVRLVARERLQQLARLHVPQAARAVAAAREQLLVGAEEAAARHVVRVARHLGTHIHNSINSRLTRTWTV